MVMPARVADARVANVLCGERAAGMQPRLRRTANEAALRISGPCFSPRDEEHGHKRAKAPF